MFQSYGIYNTTTKCIENYTFVDYVEMKSPAFLSGMRRSESSIYLLIPLSQPLAVTADMFRYRGSKG